MSRQNKKKRKIKASRLILICIVFFLFIGFGSALGFVIGMVKDLPDWNATSLESENSSLIYDSQGKLVIKLHKTENRTTVELKNIPSYLIDAFISTEDVRFREHHGIDLRRIFGAFVADIKNRDLSQGASTITMQLARNAILENQEKKIERKIKEAILAIQIERHYTKDEILYFYLNEIYFGHGANGVQAAAQTYFEKDVQELTLGEAAMLTGLVRNPSLYSPFRHPENAMRIRNVVLDNMVRYGKISKSEAEQAKKEPLKIVEFKKKDLYPYPWFTDYVIAQAEDLLQETGYESSQLYTGGFHIYTTLDPTIQKAAEDAYENSKYFPKSNSADPVQSAMVIMNPKTGEVKALIGGREHVTKRGLNRATDMRRQPGSVIKPVAVYAPALEKGYTPASIVDDAPVAFGSYKPTNYDGRYRGLITMREAVQWSVNIPAVKFLNQIGIDQGFNFAKSLGLPLDEQYDRNLSLALGGLTRGVSPLNIAAAYSSFANQGVYIQPHVITKITDQKGTPLVDFTPKKNIVMSDHTAYLMTNILKTVVDSGTGTKAKLNRPVAGKTGTTQLPDKPAFKNKKGNKDAWFAGYTPELVGVVWMGYDNDTDQKGNPQYLSKVYGGQYPAMIWKAVLEPSLRNVPVKSFEVPPGIVNRAVDIKSGKLPSSLTPGKFIRVEIFSSKNVPSQISDVWVTASIDPETGLLATENCPTKITGVFLKKPRPRGTMDANLSLPSSYCRLHGRQGETPGIELTAICTDPRHGGTPVLANIPEKGESGGCPQDFVVYKSFEFGTPPTQHCNLSDHQVIKETSGDDPNTASPNNPNTAPPNNPNITSPNNPSKY